MLKSGVVELGERTKVEEEEEVEVVEKEEKKWKRIGGKEAEQIRYNERHTAVKLPSVAVIDASEERASINILASLGHCALSLLDQAEVSILVTLGLNGSW